MVLDNDNLVRMGSSESYPAPSRMAVHYSSRSNEWATPQELFDKLNGEFDFGLDAAATLENRKCMNYLGPDHPFESCRDGLQVEWAAIMAGMKRAVWLNPPYGRQIGKWVKKAYEESQKGALVVCLIPSRTDTSYWHDYAMKGEIRFLRGRVYFEQTGKARDPAPFPSAVVIFRPKAEAG